MAVPEFGTLQAWEVRASAAARAAAGENPNDPSRSLQSGTPMPFLGDPKVRLCLLNQRYCMFVLLCNFWYRCTATGLLVCARHLEYFSRIKMVRVEY